MVAVAGGTIAWLVVACNRLKKARARGGRPDRPVGAVPCTVMRQRRRAEAVTLSATAEALKLCALQREDKDDVLALFDDEVVRREHLSTEFREQLRESFDSDVARTVSRRSRVPRRSKHSGRVAARLASDPGRRIDHGAGIDGCPRRRVESCSRDPDRCRSGSCVSRSDGCTTRPSSIACWWPLLPTIRTRS